jgi:hypothetical protein
VSQIVFCETCQWLKFPLNGLRAQSRLSPVVSLILSKLLEYKRNLIQHVNRMPRNRFKSGEWNATVRLAEGIMVDLWRGFWTRETGTGQQVAQLHDRYMMIMILVFCLIVFKSRISGDVIGSSGWFVWNYVSECMENFGDDTKCFPFVLASSPHVREWCHLKLIETVDMLWRKLRAINETCHLQHFI